MQPLAWILVGCVLQVQHGPGLLIEPGARVVFFGDSITQNGLYISYLDAILRARFASRQQELINHGLSSETISGTSEPDHDPRRPDAHDRFDRDVAAWKPDVVVACFGMNDGNYHPPDDQRLERFQDGIGRLIDRTQAVGGRLVLLTPPPFDPYRRRASDDRAKTYGYKFAAIDYDATLERFAAWERSLAHSDATVIDLHTRLNDHLRRRRTDEVSYFLAEDAVHPGETGHFLMALGLLDFMGLPAVWAEARLDLGEPEDSAGDVSGVEVIQGGRIRFFWRRPLPMPRATAWDSRSLAQEGIPGRLGRERITVAGLEPGRYELGLEAEGSRWTSDRSIDAAELARGLDLASWWPSLPLQARADELLEAVVAARARRDARWREAIVSGDGEATSRGDLLDADAGRLDELQAKGVVEVTLRRLPDPAP